MRCIFGEDVGQLKYHMIMGYFVAQKEAKDGQKGASERPISTLKLIV